MRAMSTLPIPAVDRAYSASELGVAQWPRYPVIAFMGSTGLHCHFFMIVSLVDTNVRSTLRSITPVLHAEPNLPHAVKVYHASLKARTLATDSSNIWTGRCLPFWYTRLGV